MKYAVIKMGHLNLWRESTDKEAKRDLLFMTSTGITSLAINEGRLHVDDVREFCKEHPEWAFFTAKDAKPKPTPNEMNNIVLLRKDVWQVHNVQTDKMCNKVAGSPDRHMLTIKATHAQSRRVFRIRCTHMNSHIEKRSWHRLPRFPQYQQHKRGLVNAMDRRGEIIDILSLDLNASFRNPFVRKSRLYPYAALRKHGVTCNFEELRKPSVGTHGKRLIDAFFVAKNDAKFVTQKIMVGLKSDHNGLIVEIRVECV